MNTVPDHADTWVDIQPAANNPETYWDLWRAGLRVILADEPCALAASLEAACKSWNFKPRSLSSRPD